MKRFWRWWLLAACVLCFMLSGGQKTAVIAQNDAPTIEEQAQSILNSMSAAERVGQVFLVPFVGDSALVDSSIADLILNYHVGGVVLLAQNDNITGYDNLQNAPIQVAELTNDLQRLSLLGYSTAVEPTTVEPTAVTESNTENQPEATVLPTPLLTPIPISTVNAIPLFV